MGNQGSNASENEKKAAVSIEDDAFYEQSMRLRYLTVPYHRSATATRPGNSMHSASKQNVRIDASG